MNSYIAKVEIIDEFRARVTGLCPDTEERLASRFSAEVPGYKFTNAYKSGKWNGKKGFFKSGGLTYVGLLADIIHFLLKDPYIRFLKGDGYEFPLITDKRQPGNVLESISSEYFSGKTWPKGHPCEGEEIVLRDHQIEAVNNFIRYKSSIQKIAAGTGKTVTIATLSSVLEKGSQSPARTIVIVPNAGRATQTEKEYLNLGLDVGVYCGKQKELGRTHTICTWRSLNSIKCQANMNQLLKDVKCVIVDECHKAKAESSREMLVNEFRNVPIKWGLTGTLPKEPLDLFHLKISIGPVIRNLSTS